MKKEYLTVFIGYFYVLNEHIKIIKYKDTLISQNFNFISK